MKKSITAEGHEYTIRTVNGVSTSTGAIWAKEIKVFTPLPNGFNLGLAMEAYNTIKENQHLWDQGNWRRLLKFEDITIEQAKELRAMAAFEIDVAKPVCGTAMCLAGWIGELSGADYVYDSAALKAEDDWHGDDGMLLEYVLVLRSELKAPAVYEARNFGELDPSTRKKVIERGFSEDTHALVPIEFYAGMMLGLVDGDWREMFGGSNDLVQILQAIEAYAEDGPAENSVLLEHDDLEDDDDDDED